MVCRHVRIRMPLPAMARNRGIDGQVPPCRSDVREGRGRLVRPCFDTRGFCERHMTRGLYCWAGSFDVTGEDGCCTRGAMRANNALRAGRNG